MSLIEKKHKKCISKFLIFLNSYDIMKQETEEEERQRRDNSYKGHKRGYSGYFLDRRAGSAGGYTGNRRGVCGGYGSDKTESSSFYSRGRRCGNGKGRRSGDYRVNKRRGVAKRSYYRNRRRGGFGRGRGRDRGVVASEPRGTDNAMKDVRYPTELSSLGFFSP